MMHILTHRGLDPSKGAYFAESSYEAFEDQLLRGYGLEVDVQFTKDNEIVLLHDADLQRISQGKDRRLIAELSLEEIKKLSFGGCHIAHFDELLALCVFGIESGMAPDARLALHVKGKWQRNGYEYIDLLLNKIQAHHLPLDRLLIFDLTPESASYLIQKNSRLQLAASVVHPYDQERYQSCVDGTLLTIEQLLKTKSVYAWAWMDEWDNADRDEQTKRLYTQTNVALLRAQGFKIAFVAPELHALSPGLLGGEAHPDGANEGRRVARLRELLRLRPDAICTDYPDETRALYRAQLTLLERVTHALLQKAHGVQPRKRLHGFLRKGVMRLLAFVEGRKSAFYTFHTRPMRATGYGRYSTAAPVGRVAVVIQGPLLRQRQFTIETIRLYKCLFPEAVVILSTWDDEPQELLDQCRVAGATVVVNAKPEYSGPSNVNYQVVSTAAGIREAEARGAEYVLKTRTDMRLYNAEALELLVHLIRQFPLRNRVYTQKERLITLSLGTAKYYPYHFGDLFLFGALEDMKIYWDFPLLRKWDIPDVKKALFNPEIHLPVHYLRRIGRVLQWTARDVWRVLSEHCIVVDAAMVDVYWHKYARWNEYRDRDYRAYARPQGCMTFTDWFVLYSDPEKLPPANPSMFFRGLDLDVPRPGEGV